MIVRTVVALAVAPLLGAWLLDRTPEVRQWRRKVRKIHLVNRARKRRARRTGERYAWERLGRIWTGWSLALSVLFGLALSVLVDRLLARQGPVPRWLRSVAQGGAVAWTMFVFYAAKYIALRRARPSPKEPPEVLQWER